MKSKKIYVLFDKYRPGAFALVGGFFIKPESPCGSIFLPVGSLP
jgi:hypothetical protein